LHLSGREPSLKYLSDHRAPMRLPALLALLPLALATALAAPPQPLVAVTVYEGGLAEVRYIVPTGGNVTIAIPLLGVPDESLGIVVRDEWGDPLLYAVNETLNTLFVACLECSIVTVSYYTQTLVSREGVAWTVNLTAPYRLRLALPPNATVTYISRLPDSVYTRGGRLVLEFPPGPVAVSYVVLYAAPERPGGAAPPAPQPPSGQPPSAQPSGGWPPGLLYVLAGAAAVAAALALVLARRRGRPLVAELGEEDRSILEALRRMGGGAFQSELQRELGMPATSLWRRVRRLERLGYVVIEKRAGRNYVRLA